MPAAGLGLPDSIAVVLFDLDGVLTDTAAVHRRAWKEVFDEFLARRCGPDFRPFSAGDYLRYVDGRPRADGVREFLRSRDITLPDGNSADEPGDESVNGVGNRKNALLLSLLDREGVRVYPGSVRYLEAVRAAGLPVAVVTSSANCASVLEAGGLEPFVDVRVDGHDIARQRLRGKPAPDSFVAGAALLGVKPSRAAVFEDAVAGVAAGRGGRFGYVVGVDRVRDGTHAEELARAGADVVVADLAELMEGR
ncbi:beta-phosphoglucomutase family hydrolase [Nocardia huaxiensis]|uniref:Beta-phosphoglucomutase n=1 Tax=Nocardia huaxiensis TaxID=2755382 RepID=A0A7D6Z8F8_9NOCA|nr:beta-phosphoglucomutase family hydrolase [Nocardia huaxiensis]QLY34364.1 beta-phosphoglucomutase family hydrolase [Nocardia huaxiensis]